MIYFLGVWQTGEFGIKKSVKLLNIDPCMKVSTSHHRHKTHLERSPEGKRSVDM